MANNTTLDPGTGGDTIATDDVAGVKYQRVKLVDGTEDSTVAISGDATNGLDVDVTRVSGNVAVTGPLTDTQLRATPVPISGTVTATTGGLTDTQLRATPVPVSGTVSTGGLTDTQIRATPLPVSGTVTANAGAGPFPVSDNAGSLTVDAPVGTPAFVKLSDGAASLVGQKAMAASLPVVVASDQSAIPVSGTVTASGPLTDTQLRATPVPVSGTVTVTPPTLTKAAQGATGFSTQDLKDAGRVALQFYANNVASGTTTTETAITLTKAADTGATSTGASFVITNGKRFRITAISVASRGNATATAQITTFALRINTLGAVITTSTPLVFQAASACAAVASAWDRVIIPIPDGYEILGNGTIQFGITANAVFVTNAPTWFVNISGFEY